LLNPTLRISRAFFAIENYIIGFSNAKGSVQLQNLPYLVFLST